MKRIFAVPGIRIGAWVPFLLVGLIACSSPGEVEQSTQTNVRVSGNTITWNTEEPALTAVGYRYPDSDIWNVAYPSPNLRRDKAFVTNHSVTLMRPQEGDKILVVLVNRLASQRDFLTGEEFEVELTSGPPTGPLLRWTMVDVGFGDSHFLRMPNSGKTILVDGGERQDFSNVDEFLKSESVTSLDYVMATHIHADHIGGLVGNSDSVSDGILGVYDVGMYIDTVIKSHTRFAYDEALATLANRGIPKANIQVGDNSDTTELLDWDEEVYVEILNAGGGAAIGGTSEGDQLNNDSIMFRVTMGEVNFIMGGDSEAPVETKVTAEFGEALESEVLKVHHHGVNDASNTGFLQAVNPRVGMIPIASFETSDGGLPTFAVVNRLRASGIDVYSNDRAEPIGIDFVTTTSPTDGLNITLVTNGDLYEIEVAPSRSFHSLKGGTMPVLKGQNPEDFREGDQ
ncbi:MAG: MBL fold metallo-hydrolase [Candidatus Eisenbacteria bacterium]|uniref:MBL fold metallo-hydrolase n=1 Tax=Eiseniibacteriota bacterium TaxID=2212470 RepID=A0A7Y2EAY5_UNCEI|nr:MBL fold metallo-hydrolase [Candidatus Eisenbacteria bacterium]